MTTGTFASSQDVYIANVSLTTNYKSTGNLAVGSVNTDQSLRRTLIQFNLSSIPSNATVTSAVLSMYLKADYSSNNRIYRAYRMLHSWDQNSTCWNYYSGTSAWPNGAGAFGSGDCEQTDIGSQTFPSSGAVGTEEQFVLTTSKVQEWISGVLSNLGMLIKADTENNDAWRLNASTDSPAPKLVIVYSVPTTNILKIGGVTYANVGKVEGVAIASVSKIAGLS